MARPRAPIRSSTRTRNGAVPGEAPPPGPNELERLAEVPRWPAAVALLVIGVTYALVTSKMRAGPGWLLLALIAVLLLPLRFFHVRGYRRLARGLALGAAGVATVAVAVSVGLLVERVTDNAVPARSLLRDAALIWTANVVLFALWYWEIDGGGPAHRRIDRHCSHDFLFPQMSLDGVSESWSPTFIDYLFLAFNTSTAFSPTDTLTLSHRAKLLMMAQSLISLVVIAVLAARALNTLQ